MLIMNNLSLKIQRECQSIQLTLQLKEVENLPDNVNNEKSFSINVAGALKYSVNSSVVGGGESNLKSYGLYGLVGKHVDSGLLRDDGGVLKSEYLKE